MQDHFLKRKLHTWLPHMKRLWILGSLLLVLLIGVVLVINPQAQAPGKAQIVFCSFTHGSSKISVMDADGGNIRELTENPTWNADPVWSHDGRKIAFARDDGVYEIYVMDADGNNVRKLTKSAGSSQPAWSPDGQLIVSVVRQGLGNSLQVMDANGDRPREFPLPMKWPQSPAWSPDGQTIAFSDWTTVYLIDANGRNLRPLVGGGARHSYSPAWSPDGKRIAFAYWGQGKGAGISTVDVDGENIREVVAGGGQNSDDMPAWLPDGQQIVFVRNWEEIYIVDISGENLRLLAQGLYPDCFDPQLAVSSADKTTTTWGWIKHIFQ